MADDPWPDGVTWEHRTVELREVVDKNGNGLVIRREPFDGFLVELGPFLRPGDDDEHAAGDAAAPGGAVLD